VRLSQITILKLTTDEEKKEISSNSIRKGKEMKGIQIEKDELKLYAQT
jgi:hypothetical protein